MAVTRMPPWTNARMTPGTSESARTRSPPTMAESGVPATAAHEVSARPAWIATPPAATCRSVRGKFTRYTPPPEAPARPRIWLTESHPWLCAVAEAPTSAAASIIAARIRTSAFMRFRRVRHEQTLPEPRAPEFADQPLGLGRDQEIRQRLAAGGVHPRRIPGIHFHHVIHVVQGRVALDQRDQVDLVSPGEVGRPVGDGVRQLLVGHLESGGHALPRLDVPVASRRDSRAAPQRFLQLMGPGLIPPGDERCPPRRDAPSSVPSLSRLRSPLRDTRFGAGTPGATSRGAPRRGWRWWWRGERP